MDTSDLASVVMPVSPTLAGALSGANAALAVSALGKAVVGDDQADPAAITAAIVNGADDAKLKIRAAEEQLLSAVSSAGLSLSALGAQDAAGRRDTLVKMDYQAAQDRSDARARQVKMNDITNSVLAYGVTLGFFAVIFLLYFYPKLGPTLATDSAGRPIGVDPDIKASLQTLLGVLGTAWVGVMTYYFGSSVGSKEKNALLEESVAAKASAAGASAAGG